MTARFENVLRRYGQTVTATRGGASWTAQAFVQPPTDSGGAEPVEHTELGSVDARRWVCLTRGDIGAGDTVVCDAGTFTVRACAGVYLGGELCHRRAVLVPAKKAAE